MPRRIGIFHPCLRYGGSEARAAWALEGLSGLGERVLVSACHPQWERLDAAYGTRLQQAELQARCAPGASLIARQSRAAALIGTYYQHFARRAATDIDVPISTYNLCDFGRPGIQFIADFSWHETLRAQLDGGTQLVGASHFGQIGLPMRLYRQVVGRIAGSTSLRLLGGADRIVANSRWTAARLHEHFGIAAMVIYPPVPDVLAITPEPTRRDDIACLGRISPEKRLEEIIELVERLRHRGWSLGLRLLGHLDEGAYARHIRRLALDRPWLRLDGWCTGLDKARILRQCRYGAHACRGEAFGIAVAELVKAGCLTLVPRVGAPAEIVAEPGLIFTNVEDAVAKLEQLLRDPVRRARMAEHLQARGRLFGTAGFVASLRELVVDFAERRGRDA